MCRHHIMDRYTTWSALDEPFLSYFAPTDIENTPLTLYRDICIAGTLGSFQSG